MAASPRSTTARGYGTSHQAERDRWAPLVAAGDVNCARCGNELDPEEPWDLGHSDDRTAYNGPEHVSCNRSAGGRNGARAANAKRQTTVREPW